MSTLSKNLNNFTYGHKIDGGVRIDDDRSKGLESRSYKVGALACQDTRILTPRSCPLSRFANFCGLWSMCCRHILTHSVLDTVLCCRTTYVGCEIRLPRHLITPYAALWPQCCLSLPHSGPIHQDGSNWQTKTLSIRNLWTSHCIASVPVVLYHSWILCTFCFDHLLSTPYPNPNLPLRTAILALPPSSYNMDPHPHPRPRTSVTPR